MPSPYDLSVLGGQGSFDPGVSGLPSMPPPPQPESRFQQILGGLLGPGKQYGGLLDPAMQQQIKNQTLLNIGASLLASSRNGQGLGANAGQAILGSQQAKQQSIDEQIRNMILLRGKPPEPYTLSAGQKRFDANNQAVAAVAEKTPGEVGTVTPKDYTPESVQKYQQTHNFSDLVPVDPKKSPGDIGTVKPEDFTPASVAKYSQTHNIADLVRTYAPTSASQTNASVSDQAIKFAADTYRSTGKFPTAMGRNPALQARVLNMVAADATASGDSVGAINARQSALKANNQALDQVTKLESATTAYYNTLDKNLTNLQEISGKVDSSGVPLINKVYRAYQQNVSGDPEVAKYVTYLRAASSEFAKIQSGTLGNAPASDAARRDADEVLNKYLTKGQLDAVVQAMRGEGNNRLQSIAEQKKSLLTDLGQGVPTQGGQTPSPTQPVKTTPTSGPPPGYKLMQDAHGNKAYVGPNGEIQEVQ